MVVCKIMTIGGCKVDIICVSTASNGNLLRPANKAELDNLFPFAAPLIGGAALVKMLKLYKLALSSQNLRQL